MEINNGATFVVLEQNKETGRTEHAVFVHGVDVERKEYIVLDSDKDRRDSYSHQINGVKKPNQRVPWYMLDPNNPKIWLLTEVVIVQICPVIRFGKKYLNLSKVDFLQKPQVQALPKGEHTPAFILRDPTKYTQFIDD